METGREAAVAVGKMDQRGCSGSRGQQQAVQGSNGAAQVVASTASKVEEENDMTSAAASSPLLSHSFGALPGAHILVLFHHWCFIY